MQVQRRPDEREEELEVPARILRGACLEVGDERLDRRVAAGHAEGRGLDDRQGRERRPRRREQRDDGAVGVRREVVSRLEQPGELLRLHVEVDRVEGRVRRVARPDGDDELEAVGERLLRVPGEPSGRDRAVDEDEPGTRAETLDMHRTMMNENPLAERVFAVTSFGMLASSG